MNILYNDIINCFDLNEWDFSYLTGQEIFEVLNQPIKLTNHVDEIKLYGQDFQDDSIFLVVVKHSYDFDYTITKFFPEILNKNFNLTFRLFECNYKYAAVKAGLGQYAKNSLFHHPKFDFDSHLAVYLFQDNIIGLPKRNASNFNLLAQCEGCNDCINACPAHAINLNDMGRTWINLQTCDNFCHFGNGGRIPSIKWNLVKINNIPLTQEQVYKITNFPQWIQAVGSQGEFLKINGNSHHVIFPVCRECTSQKRCTKYGGKYPYDWNRVLIFDK